MFRLAPLQHRAARMAALALLAIALPLSCSLTDEEDEAGAEQLLDGCGVERWAVKTGTDTAAPQVDLTPRESSIAALGALPVPAGLGSRAPRLAGTEFQTFRLRNVILSIYKAEADSDYHLVLTDGRSSLIAEIPAIRCSNSTPWMQQLSATRAAFDAKYTATGSFKTANAIVSVTGVGFFDLRHGQTGIAPNGIELHPLLSICFGQDCDASVPGGDFALAADPAALTAQRSASAQAAVSTTIKATPSGGFEGSIALSVSGVPEGASAALSASTIAAAGEATLSLTAGSAAPGTYPITVTGTGGGRSRAAVVRFTVVAGGAIVSNGGFETASLFGWQGTGSVAISRAARTGGSSARVGSTGTFAGDSALWQTVAVPATGTTTLTFWYRPHTSDSFEFDQQRILLKSTSGTTLKTLLEACSGTAAWTKVTADLTPWAGRSVVLWFSVHDDGHPGDPTWFYVDDVAVTNAAPQAPIELVANGAFESGTAGWTLGGSGKVPIASTAHPHGGAFSLRLGATAGGTAEPNGASWAWQELALPASATRITLTFWYWPYTADTIAYDWQDAKVLSADGNTTLIDIFHQASNAQTWLQRTVDLTPLKGRTVRLFFNCHGDGAGDPTTLFVDDVSVAWQ